MLARANPFRVERLHGLRYRSPGGERSEDLLARWEAAGRRGALVGEHGRGKSTALEEMLAELASRGQRVERIRLRADEPEGRAALRDTLRGAGPGDVLAVDGYDLLPWTVRRRVRRHRCAGLLVTSHAPTRLRVLARFETTPALLRDLVAELLEGTGFEGPPPEELDRLHEDCGGDLRLALFTLYDRCADPTIPCSLATPRPADR